MESHPLALSFLDYYLLFIFYLHFPSFAFSALTLLACIRKSIWPIKNELIDADVVICVEQDANELCMV